MTNNPKIRGISRSILILTLGIIIGGSVIGSAVYFLLQQGSPAQQASQTQKPVAAPPVLQKIKASVGRMTQEAFFLVADAGRERGIWDKYGLDPEFVSVPGGRVMTPADLKEMVASGIGLGFITQNDVLLARSDGVPVKIIAGYTGKCNYCRIYVKADSSMSTVKDLDGKKIGVLSAGGDWRSRFLSYMSKKFEIKLEAVPLGNLTNNIVALKLGRIDAFVSADGAVLRLVDSGELRMLTSFHDIVPGPWASASIWATDDLIRQNPDLVKRFVTATLESVKYLKENPDYAADLYSKRTGAPKDLADQTIAQLDWTPNGRGSGTDLINAVTNGWLFIQYDKESGAVSADINVNIEDAVDIRFLP